jgi:hypothetical protein
MSQVAKSASALVRAFLAILVLELSFGNEAAANCSKDETLHRSHPIANLPSQKAPEAVSPKSLICQSPQGRLSRADVFWLCYPALMRSAIWIGVFIGSTIGGLIPLLWGDDMLSYSGVLLSGVGVFVGLWLGSRASR